MLRTYTYVVGAGASVEFGFPVGETLTAEIAKLLKFSFDNFSRFQTGDRVLASAFEGVPHPDGNVYRSEYLLRISADISRNMGLAPSIDNYLEAQKDKEGIPEVGKMAIARAILQHERKCGLWVDWRKGHEVDFSRLNDNWLTRLFRVLTAQRGLDSFSEALAQCRFVTFNYDRVIEHFFAKAIGSYFGLNANEVAEFISQHLNIVHVYGSLGNLGDGTAVGFGDFETNYLNVQKAGARIKTFTEGIDDQEEIQTAKKWLQESNCLIFMGFAFLPLNLQALRPDEPLQCERILGTAYGVSKDNLNISKAILNNMWTKRPPEAFDFRPVTCSELISDLSGYLGEHDLIK